MILLLTRLSLHDSAGIRTAGINPPPHPPLQAVEGGVGEVGASVARCPRTPPDAAKTSGLQIGLSNRLRGL